MLTDQLDQQQRRNCGADKGHHGQRERVGEDGTVTIFSLGKGAEKLQNPPGEQQHQGENGAQLDHDGVHLPVRAGQVDVEQRLHQPQVRG